MIVIDFTLIVHDSNVLLYLFVCTIFILKQKSNKSMFTVDLLRSVRVVNFSKFMRPFGDLTFCCCSYFWRSFNSNKIKCTVNSNKLLRPVSSSELVCPVDVHTINSNKHLCPVNHCKPVCLVDVVILQYLWVLMKLFGLFVSINL